MNGSRRNAWAALALAGAAAAAINAAAAARAERRRPPFGRLLEVDGVRLHVAERGDGPPVLLLHGNGATLEDWLIAGVADALAESHRVILVDRPGFGHSARPRRTRWTPERQARLLRGLTDRLGAERATVVGQSWGTLVALAYALDYPDATAALGVVSGYYRPTARLDVVPGAAPAVPVVGDVLRYTVSPVIGRALTPAVYRHLFAPAKPTAAFRARFPLALSLRPSQLRATGEDTALMIPAAARLSVRLDELAAPTLIVHGDGDKIVSYDHARWLRARLPEAELLTIPGAGHMVHHLAPERVADAIRRLVARAA